MDTNLHNLYQLIKSFNSKYALKRVFSLIHIKLRPYPGVGYGLNGCIEVLQYLNFCVLSAELACAVTDNHVNDDGLLAVFSFELFCYNLLEVVYQLVCNEVDGATTEATAHDA